jgi:hypothetical protein
MAVQIGTRLKAQVLKAVIDQVAGGSCTLEEREDSIKIVLSPEQKQWFKDFLDKQLDMKTKPDIEIDALGIILPVIFKRTWPYLAAGGAGLAALVFGKGKKEENEY